MIDFLMELLKISPMIALLSIILWVLMKYVKDKDSEIKKLNETHTELIKDKDKQIIELSNASVKAISVYEVHMNNVNRIQQENSKDHIELKDDLKDYKNDIDKTLNKTYQELKEILNKNLTILEDLKNNK